ncbi:hypothetical protein [Thiomonas sp. FB-6]|uniref:hypothetical protein n=1 Tax=Thiomonas sp. FB-6 TaxID=1158291 RepID=UPI0003792DA8|nr:hypothetical protein [Thiomonas sp. FB-6]
MVNDEAFLPLVLAGGMALLCGLVAIVMFGFGTVRRLRKHPELRDSFGLQPLPGFATVNAALALTVPRSFARMLAMSPLFPLMANGLALHRHTSPGERRLARFAFLSMLSYVLMSFVLSDLKKWGPVTGTAIAVGRAAAYLLAFGSLPSLLTFGEVRRAQRLKTRGPNKLDDWWAELMDSLK